MTGKSKTPGRDEAAGEELNGCSPGFEAEGHGPDDEEADTPADVGDGIVLANEGDGEEGRHVQEYG
jgi:hypothetical protein